MKRVSKPILLALMVALLSIGAHQTYLNGFASSYWIFMILLLVFFFYNFQQGGKSNTETS
jgi:hypothetical protein